MKVRTTMCLASAVMAIGVVSWPVAAHADAGVSGRLCADPTHECTVSVMGGHAREVAYSGVDVTGAPGVRLRVAAYYVRTDAHGKLTGLERFAVGDKRRSGLKPTPCLIRSSCWRPRIPLTRRAPMCCLKHRWIVSCSR